MPKKKPDVPAVTEVAAEVSAPPAAPQVTIFAASGVDLDNLPADTAIAEDARTLMGVTVAWANSPTPAAPAPEPAPEPEPIVIQPDIVDAWAGV